MGIGDYICEANVDVDGKGTASCVREIFQERFESETMGAHIVHIAGKSNLKLKKGEESKRDDDFSEYVNETKTDETNFQADLRKLQGVIRTIGETGTEVVITFDGDNLQTNSPFTQLIEGLIRSRYRVYAVKDSRPFNKLHIMSWKSSPYFALVNLHDIKERGKEAFTMSHCSTYVSYGVKYYWGGATQTYLQLVTFVQRNDVIEHDTEERFVTGKGVDDPKDLPALLVLHKTVLLSTIATVLDVDGNEKETNLRVFPHAKDIIKNAKLTLQRTPTKALEFEVNSDNGTDSTTFDLPHHAPYTPLLTQKLVNFAKTLTPT